MEEIANEEMPKERLEKTLTSGKEEGGYMENYSKTWKQNKSEK